MKPFIMKSLIMMTIVICLASCSSSSTYYAELEPYTTYTIYDRFTKVMQFTTRGEDELNYGRYTISKKNTGDLIVSKAYQGFAFRYDLTLMRVYDLSEDGDRINASIIIEKLSNKNKFEEINHERLAHYYKVTNSKRDIADFRFTTYYQAKVDEMFGFTCNKKIEVKENVTLNFAIPPDQQRPFNSYNYSYHCPLLINNHTWVLNLRISITIDREELLTIYGQENLPSDEDILIIVQQKLKTLVDSIQFLLPMTQEVPENLK